MVRQAVRVGESSSAFMAYPTVILALSLGSCGSTAKPKVPSMDPSRIIATYAESALEVQVATGDAAQRGALGTLLERSTTAQTRKDIIRQWNDLPALRALDPDLLERKVFLQAEADADWPMEPIPEDKEKDVYVEGVRSGVRAFLGGGS